MKAEKLIIGNIITADIRNPIFEAVTVKDGKVQYVGSLDVAKKLCDENTEVLDYGDNYVYPGFIEGHCHGVPAGVKLAFFANLSEGNTVEDYLAIVKEYIDNHPDDELIYGAGWKSYEFSPNSQMLDEICSDKVVALISIDGHSVWLNTKAMEKFGVTPEFAQEMGTDLIRVDENGNPIGFLSEFPAIDITKKMYCLDKESSKKALLIWQDFLLSQGYTAYYEAGCVEYYLDIFKELIDEGNWHIRIFTSMLMDETEEDYVACVRRAKELADKYNCEYLNILGVKIFMDGVVEAHTAWLLDEYNDQPGYYGNKRFCDFDRTVELYREAEKLGLSVHQHTIGDGAVKFALDCIEKVQVETGNMHMRNALAHLQVVSKEDIKRICDLNVVAVVAPLWISRGGAEYRQSSAFLGDKRAFYTYPVKSFEDRSGIIAFHTDFPVSPLMDAPKSIYMACKRNNPEEDVYFQLNVDECLSRESALAALTLGPAYSVKADDHLGQIIIGYAANMTVYDKNFLTDDINEISKAKLIATIVDGNELYSSTK